MATRALALILCFIPLAGGIGCSRRAAFNRSNVVATEASLHGQYPWLGETCKHWRQEADLSAATVPGYADLGCFAVGNGRLFAALGLRYPLGTLSNLFGPTYQKTQGSLGWQQPVVLTGRRPLDLPLQSQEWVLRAGVVHTRLANRDGVRLDVYDCVPPDGYAIVRVLVLTNDSRRALGNMQLALAHSGGLGASDGKLVSDGPPRWVRIGLAGSRTEAVDELRVMPLPAPAQAVSRISADGTGGTVLCPVGRLKPGESVAKLGYTVVAPTAQAAEAEEKRLEQAGFAVLGETHDWWRKWFADALTLETPDERINEFLPIQQYLCRVQQAESGGYSPMYMYTTCWVRDSNGPVRFLTQSGKFEEVKRYLDYYYACSAQARNVPMNFPLDLPVKTPPSNPDWPRAPVARAEVASFIILQHYWYWKQSGDLTPVKAHWGYLRRNLLGQRVDAQGRLPFFGDETYRFPGYQIFEATQKEPTDWVSMDLLSADSAWEYIAAAYALHEWAVVLGKAEEAAEYEGLAWKVREALDRDFRMEDRGYYAPAISDFSGEQYRYPFANINLTPPWLEADLAWWTGDPSEDIEPLRSALRATELLWKASGTVKSTPGCGYYVGMTPGMAVWALAQDYHASLDQAIEGLLTAASPSGEYSEMVRPDDRPSDKHWGKNRIRPWEGGINGEALVKGLLGLLIWAPERSVGLYPRFLKGWEAIGVRNIRVADSRLDVELRQAAGKWSAEVRVEGKSPVRVYLTPVEAVVRPGQTRTLTTETLPSNGFPFRPVTKAFDYGEPTFAGKAKTIVVTWSQDTFAAYRRSQSPAAIDTKIAFPPEYLAAALYGSSGRRRADRLILDVSRYPGHCKTAEFWKTGEGDRVVDRFRQLGGRVEQYPRPQDKPPDLFGQ